jgi:adenosylhomocysteine nucleosidase
LRAPEPNRATARAVKRQTHILICFALNAEAAPFRKIGPGRPEVSILITGVGRRNADKAVRSFLADHSPERVLTCGFAGGLNPALAAGDVVFETEDPVLRNLLTKAGAKPARCFCAARVAVTAAEKQALRRTTGADVVEMESEAIQALCRERSVPCATLRAVSDPADEDLPLDFNELMTPAQGMNYCRVTAALLKSPAKIRSLLKLRRQCAAAAAALAQVLARVTSS